MTVRFASAELGRPFDDAEQVLAIRKAEADEFYRAVAADDLTEDERLAQRQALAGLLWSKQFYNYRVRRWLKGDSGQPPPPDTRWSGRNSDWQHFAVTDVILMPDAWEYPWFAAWDLAFHCVAMALIDPEFAKEQILVLQQSTAQHPHGQIPAYEWSFGDTNPPVLAWAAWQVYQLDRRHSGAGDRFPGPDLPLGHAERDVVAQPEGQLRSGVFGGGFLGMDNIGVFDRDQPLPTGENWPRWTERRDGRADLPSAGDDHRVVPVRAELPVHVRPVAVGRLAGRQRPGEGQWPGQLLGRRHRLLPRCDRNPTGTNSSLRVFSIQSIVPLFAAIAIPTTSVEALETINRCLDDLSEAYEHTDADVRLRLAGGDGSHFMIAIVHPDRLSAMLDRLLDPAQFLRSRDSVTVPIPPRAPVHLSDERAGVRGQLPAGRVRQPDVRWKPNWRGPVWLPINVLLVQALDSYARFLGGTFTVADPADSDRRVDLATVADDLARRLTGLLVRDGSGRRAVHGDNEYFQTDPNWRDLVPFYEYFDGDTGRGLGASHQTGWTAMVALLLQFRGKLRFD